MFTMKAIFLLGIMVLAQISSSQRVSKIYGNRKFGRLDVVLKFWRHMETLLQ